MTVNTTSAVPKTKLTTLRLVGRAYALFFQNALMLLRLALPWLVLVFIINASLNWCIWPAEVSSWPASNHFGQAALAVSTVLVTLAGSSIAVNWHRAILLNEPLAHAPMFRLDGIVQTYFAVAMFLTLMGVFPLFTLLHMIEVGNNPPALALAMASISLLLAIWVAVRLTPLFPAIAIDDPHSNMGWTWSRTAGLFFQLFGGALLTFVLPVSVAIAILYFDPNLTEGPPANRTAFSVFNALVDVAMMFFGLVTTAFASLVYREIKSR